MCPECSGKTKVIETRRVENVTYRKRKCVERGCGASFVTEERATRDRKFPMAVIDKSLDRLNNWRAGE